MYKDFKEHYQGILDDIKGQGLWKDERIVKTPQGSIIDTTTNTHLLNFCANNYLGLASNPDVVNAARESYDKWGYGMSSVRFIVGTLEVHKELEKEISNFLKTEDTILYSSCYDANGGLFETLLGPEDAIISDSLNHASIIDGVRLCKAKRYRYDNNNMESLEEKLREAVADGAKIKMIATDGVFSMDGIIANLKGICELAEKYGAMVMVDDSHATGFVGATGRGSGEYNGVMDRVDIITSTLGKALGGASGGFASGKKEIISLLRQRSRPYLFSNTLAPAIAYTSLHILRTLSATTQYRDILEVNTQYFREKMKAADFDIPEGVHPIVPVMLYDAVLATTMADKLLEKGIYVIGFSYPVVPKGQARIRTQLSASHTREDIDRVVQAFIDVRDELA